MGAIAWTSLATLFVSFGLSFSALAANPEGQLKNGQFQNQFGSRAYTLFMPSKPTAQSGLLVVLHGCFMTGQQMIDGASFNALAEKKSVFVLYPEQSYQDNVWKCWNWFQPQNQSRNTGELSILAGMTQDVIKQYSINAGKVFVTGLSAGGATVSNLIGCYSDIFAGGAVHSGLEYAAAQTEDEAHQVTKSGPTHDLDQVVKQALACSPTTKKLIKGIVLQGDADPYVNPINGHRTASFFEKLNTQIFLANGHSASEITSTKTQINPTEPHKFVADIDSINFAGEPIVQKIIIKGMGHGWSGGKPTAPYMEPRGIDASDFIFADFFK